MALEIPLRPAAHTGPVILVHGLWMAAPVCAPLAWQLRARGHEVASFSYRSVRHTLEESAARVRAFILARHAEQVHLVGHSLGGLVVLRALAQAPHLPVGRVVLLGSPATGSAAVEQLAPTARGRLLVGAALPGWKREWGEDAARDYEVAAIAGTRRLGVGMLVVRLNGANDGVVRVEETRLHGLKDHLVLPLTHSQMLVSGRVVAQIDAFLRAGSFIRPPPASL
jgi:pimeloyl-ACP methyl ester carboxylesterase